MEGNNEKLTIEEFESLSSRRRRGGGKAASWQRQVVEAMDIGTALRVNHEGIGHNSNGCGFKGIRRGLEALYPARIYRVKHDEEGNVLVACYARLI